MKGKPTDYWGKLERAPGTDRKHGPVVAWHPLLAHCADVAACVEALLRRTLLGVRLACLLGRTSLDTVTIARLCVLALLHDLGKLNHGFQAKDEDAPREVAGHVREILAFLPIPGARPLAVTKRVYAELEFVARWNAVNLLVASICHHGRPLCAEAIHARDDFWTPKNGKNPVADVARFVTSARQWFPEAFESDAPPFPSSPAFQHAFEGLVMLADWIGSDRTLFPFAETLDDRMPDARRFAEGALVALGLDVQCAREGLGHAPPGFDRVLPRGTPHEAQRTVHALPVHAKGSLTILESETGSGKTEAALARFLKLFHAGAVDGMTFALPTRTAATQIHERIRSAVARTFENPHDRPPVVLAVPGYLRVDEAHGVRLPGFEVLWNDDDPNWLRHRGWAAENAKRFLAGAIVVGTIDQVLLSSLRVGHAHLRATALFRHLLVVDEVHASDAYMTRILRSVLQFHARAGGHAFLMSATLGTSARADFEAAVRGSRPPAELPFEEAKVAAYPAVHDAPVGESLATTSVRAPGLPKEIDVEVAALADHAEVLASRALDAARRGARVVVLRNTVTDAVETQLALEAAMTSEDENLAFTVRGIRTLHHARFSRDDRQALDDAIEARLGRNGPRDGGIVVVATQTVQQSLDLDADFLLTDLAPMDVLLQRLGRLHRHPERNAHRPTGFERPKAVILIGDASLEDAIRADGAASGPHGVGTVYDDVLVLRATQERLGDACALHIPADNRELVETTTHPEALDALAARLGEPWQRHRGKIEGIRLAHEGIATLALIDRTAPLGRYAFRDDELDERLRTRLGEDDRRVVFASAPTGPFGQPVKELTLPGWMVRDVPAGTDENAEAVEMGTEGFRFEWGEKLWEYGRLGVVILR